MNSIWSFCPETLNSSQNPWFLVPCDLQIWLMTLKNNSALFLCCFKLCEPFHSHQWIKTKVGDLLPHVNLKFNGWPWKTTAHLFYVASSLMHHFIAISEFKLKLHAGTAQFGSKLAILCPVWPCNLTDDLEKQYGTSSMLLQALCIISLSYVNSYWSYSP